MLSGLAWSLAEGVGGGGERGEDRRCASRLKAGSTL